tara:strand:+ start:222 stop:557 length:336 start_codon:yes stop_codon:yes gene_type:complete
MSRLELILSAILTLSVLFNIGITLYARSVIVKLLSVSEELGDLKTMIDNFYNHLTTVYEMEMFYGDETLAFLVEHSRSLAEQLETFEYIYTLTEADTDNEQEEINKNDNNE